MTGKKESGTNNFSSHSCSDFVILGYLCFSTILLHFPKGNKILNRTVNVCKALLARGKTLSGTMEAQRDHNNIYLTTRGSPILTQSLVGAGSSCSHLWPLALTKCQLESFWSISGTSLMPIAFEHFVQRPL